MNVNLILLIILGLLMIKIGGERGRLALAALFFNLTFMFIMLILFNWGFSPIIVTLLASVSITAMNLFFINGYSKKTLVAFNSSLIVLVIMMFFIFLSISFMHLQGLPSEELMEMDMYSMDVGLSFVLLSISVMTMSVVGAINDIAISITSAISEVHFNSPDLTEKELYQSGMTVGKDVLASTINTLIFALVGSQIALLVWVSDLHYTLAQFFNTKILVTEWVSLLLSGISIALTIPISTKLMIKSIKKP
ncbi:YibE/F family protein [Vagococcus fluvialis]|uniref:YibE/F family protein n=1 Tax=Vagococcus fluvialis TaxID=2738 RepID=UPI00143304FC|nr:YibE/F family protein [Vagococcus fluvialis]NKC60486.1 YibE/F family protein [Vagococcus fluvialis]NKD51269.1 YibE/F family protein [Vagococcus fluvialis]UDM74205.1 YibE/F family protein [Vagococcus fluvialis]